MLHRVLGLARSSHGGRKDGAKEIMLAHERVRIGSRQRGPRAVLAPDFLDVFARPWRPGAVAGRRHYDGEPTR